jgi:Tfp pilus assembly protein PilN
LGVEVRLGDPLEGLDAAKDAVRDGARISHRLEQALSAALGGTGGVNLLPPEIKEEMKRVVARGTLEVVGVSIVVVAALIFVGMKIRLGNLEKRISVAGLELSSLRLQLRKAEANALAHRVLVDEPQWEDIFTELGNLLPPNVHLTNLKIMNNAIYLKGVVASADGEQVLANLILTLEKGLFRNVKLVASRQIEGQTGIEFELKCWIDYENS